MQRAQQFDAVARGVPQQVAISRVVDVAIEHVAVGFDIEFFIFTVCLSVSFKHHATVPHDDFHGFLHESVQSAAEGSFKEQGLRAENRGSVGGLVGLRVVGGARDFLRSRSRADRHLTIR